MKFSISIFTLFITFSIFSQTTQLNGEVEYLTTLKLGLPVNALSKLQFSGLKSKFLQGAYDSNLQEEDIKIVEMGSEDNLDKIYVDFKKMELVNHTFLGDNSYLVSESLAPKWNLSDESKEILDYKCYKATGNFRGRFYTLWYTNSIPIGAGPWKLNNLPGLILEASDDTGSVVFSATKVSITNGDAENSRSLYNKNEGENLSLRDFVAIKKEYEKEQIKQLMSKFPKDMIVSEFSEAGKESNLEVMYEWEK